jgi:hypothetical protein
MDGPSFDLNKGKVAWAYENDCIYDAYLEAQKEGNKWNIGVLRWGRKFVILRPDDSFLKRVWLAFLQFIRLLDTSRDVVENLAKESTQILRETPVYRELQNKHDDLVTRIKDLEAKISSESQKKEELDRSIHEMEETQEVKSHT